MGINPGYKESENKKEQEQAERQGLFYFSCHFFDYCKGNYKGLITYYANIAGFLKRFYEIEKIDWDWFQENFINLEFIPYHSENADGLRINDVKKFKEIYFKIITKFLDYLQPQKEIFINGFPTFKNYFENEIFENSMKFKKYKNFWRGQIENKFDFIGLPFLTRVKDGKESLVKNIKIQTGIYGKGKTK